MWRRSLGSAEASLVICHFYWDTQREPLRRRASKRSRRDICHAVISAVISCRLLSPATDWANIYLNTFSIILGHHTAMIILMSCGISKGSNQWKTVICRAAWQPSRREINCKVFLCWIAMIVVFDDKTCLRNSISNVSFLLFVTVWTNTWGFCLTRSFDFVIYN